MLNIIIKLLCIIALIVLSISLLLHFGFIKQEYISPMIDGKISSCPLSPNCVSTSDKENDLHYVAPIIFISPALIKEDLIKTVLEIPRARLVSSNEYLHFEFKTFLGFIDDVALLIDEDAKVIYIRSASRLGYSDFGANLKRYNAIKNKIEENKL